MDKLLETIKQYLSLIVLCLIVVAIVVLVIVKNVHTSSDSLASNPTKAQPGYSVTEACSLLTDQIAREIIGPDVSPASSNGAGGASKDIYVSICSYGSGSESSPTGIDSVSLIVRSAKDKAGALSNSSTVSSDKTSEKTTMVNGYAAYWNQKNGQLTIAKGSDLIYVTASGDNSNAADNIESNAIQAANIILPGKR